ncbi:cysteine hydrolase family protein [Alicyclobacillus sp. ALC3]|uniref:cysteine hydrolase family protein n=1 Tax=Alicyclobacillus sp. ALC3 TaxID=2796143 RepID=UPI002379C427|nr:cysteine hydrolase family protein [Alicyclobacillus sp. ALC3]WDL98412.1 cysteine hydrolase [Alicyclobacillus sp. ALC3]
MSVDTVLIVIDVQVGMFAETDPVYAGDRLLEQTHNLISRARSTKIPVIYVQHNEGTGEPLETGTSGWHIHPSISPLKEDLIIQKFTPDAFHETALHDELTKRRIRTIVVAGMQTDVCVDATSRRAHELGYDVIIAGDTHSTWNQGDLSAQEIIDQYNASFRSFATVKVARDVEF